MHTHLDTHDHPGHDAAGHSDVDMARLLELDAEVLASYLTELTGWLADLADSAPERILDLGSGPGTGSLALARRFGGATITAVDISAQMLHRLRAQAAAHGVGDRIRTLEADTDEPWAGKIGTDRPYDLIWAAAFLHHAADPGRTLAEAFEHLRPGGLLAVTEMDFFPRFLPDDLGIGRPGLETRLHAATNDQPAHEWADHIREAGFRLEERRTFEIRLDRTQAGPALRDYALTCLTRLHSHADALDADDRATWQTLLDTEEPASIARRDDLGVHAMRTAWVARRP